MDVAKKPAANKMFGIAQEAAILGHKWSPDNKIIIFGMSNGAFKYYDPFAN